MMRSDSLRHAIDYALPLAFIACTVAATSSLLKLAVPPFLVTSIVVGAMAVAAAILERARPERSDYSKPDQPLAVDAAHFFVNYQLGYALALGGSAAIGFLVKAQAWEPLWPNQWPLALQIVLAGVLAEGISYWQHRLAHRVPWLWRFHALHHSGARLNLIRAGRFHFVDIGAAAFLAFAPLVALGAPETTVTWVAAIGGVIGVLGHANIRMRTPSWLDWMTCTPAVHRHHHSIELKESDRNFGTVVMLFDVLFGTFDPPRPDGPVAVGIQGDTLPSGFWNQVFSPFRRAER